MKPKRAFQPVVSETHLEYRLAPTTVAPINLPTTQPPISHFSPINNTPVTLRGPLRNGLASLGHKH